MRSNLVALLIGPSAMHALSAQAVDIIIGSKGPGAFSGRVLTPVSTTTVLDMMLEADTVRQGGSLG